MVKSKGKADKAIYLTQVLEVGGTFLKCRFIASFEE